MLVGPGPRDGAAMRNGTSILLVVLLLVIVAAAAWQLTQIAG